MSLSLRMWLLGAALPCAVFAVVLLGADQRFHAALESALDRALLAQAAVESASLFDGPDGRPHLHMASSPLVESVRPFAPEGALFGPDGAELARFPPRVLGSGERIEPPKRALEPAISTHEGPRGRERILTVTVAHTDGAVYTLRLRAAMAQLDAAAATFRRLSLLATLVCALVLVSAQTVHARALRRRLSKLATHVEALRTGDLDRELATEEGGDEVAALGRVLGQATVSLRGARAARERLVADAAHELRTPLTLMRTSLDLALRRERSREELIEAMRETREEVDRLALLASRLLDVAALAQADDGSQRCELSEVAEQAVECARAEAAARGLSLRFEGASGTAIEGRTDALRRALDNLLSNALKYARSSILVRVTRDAERVRVSVSDDGPGIDPAERDAVFEPFHRAPGSAPGAGLGLTIVREVARAFRGAAYVSARDRGAEIVMELPALTQAS